MSTDIIEELNNILLYKGTNTSSDPITGASFFSVYGEGDNTYKWFTSNSNVAEIYGHNPGDSVWVYMLQDQQNLIKVYDDRNHESTILSLKILDNMIDEFTPKFKEDNDKKFKNGNDMHLNKMLRSLNDINNDIDINTDDIDMYLKFPFGLISATEQYELGYKNDSNLKYPKPIDLINIVNNVNDYYIKKQCFQRWSYHTYDKYLMVFLNRFKDEFIKHYRDYKAKKNQIISKDYTINGYIATNWKTMWQNPGYPCFHEELCLFETNYNSIRDAGPLIFIGRYKLINNEKVWIKPNGYNNNIMFNSGNVNVNDILALKDELRFKSLN